ncbi:MAG TPA: DUF4056 domain-containing protein [Bacteriovoracaceae bacterium]|nr:DUF4056 domain-containing protein [Bacteriovoracaceae bacterium]
MKLMITVFTLFFIQLSVAADQDIIAEFSRPCCSFGLDVVQKAVGAAGALGNDDLGIHNYARETKKDNVGMMYTCSAGFIDISHLRDTADWSSHIYSKLPVWLGSGKTVRARKEGGFKSRSVFFPVIDSHKLLALKIEDKERIAVAITNSMALLHEIATAFPISVSVPGPLFFVYERVSAFSVEDAFSNLQGAWLGVIAARDERTYNDSMTQILYDTMVKYGAQSRENTLNAYQIIKNDWWTASFYNTTKNVLRRDFTYEGMVTAHLVDELPFCMNEEPVTLEIPDLLSDGSSVNDYFKIQGEMSARMKRKIKKLNLNLGTVITQKDFPRIIEALKVNFVRELGPQILY